MRGEGGAYACGEGGKGWGGGGEGEEIHCHVLLPAWSHQNLKRFIVTIGSDWICNINLY